VIRVTAPEHIGPGTVVGCVPTREVASLDLCIGPGAVIRSGTVIYLGSTIGQGLDTGHNAVIREENEIGDEFRLWSGSVVGYGCRIGHRVKVHCNVFVAEFTVIEDEAFIGPGTVITNDWHPGCPRSPECMQGPTIRRRARIGGNCTILPRVVIGAEALVGAGSVVTRDVPPGAVVAGNPARVINQVSALRCQTGMREQPYSAEVSDSE